MLIVTNCTSADCAAVADLWNAKTQDQSSCWSGAPTIDADGVAAMLANSDFAWNVVRDDVGNLAGFGGWWSIEGSMDISLFALASLTDEAYDRLILALAQWGLSAGKEQLIATVSANLSPEWTLWNDLGVVTWEPAGFAPLLAGQDSSQRVPTLLRGSCDLNAILAAVEAKIGGP